MEQHAKTGNHAERPGSAARILHDASVPDVDHCGEGGEEERRFARVVVDVSQTD